MTNLNLIRVSILRGARTRSAIAVMGVFALCASCPRFASAADICVRPDRDGCEQTIQQGVDAASAGDTVTIHRGRYDENVVIGAGKDGLTLVGSKVVLDGYFPNTGVALTVQSDDVTIERLTIRNSLADLVFAEANGLTLSRVTVEGSREHCVRIYGDNSSILRSTFRYCASGAVSVDGAATSIIGSKGLYVGNDAFRIAGDDAVVRGNKVRGLAGDGVEILGDRSQVVRNQISYSDNVGIQITGFESLVAHNVLRVLDSEGIEVDSRSEPDNGVVGNGGEILNNQIFSSTNNECIRVWGLQEYPSDNAFDQVVVRDNSCRFAIDHGILVRVTGAATVENNVVRDSGTSANEPCIRVLSEGAVIRGNSASGCAAGGVWLQGSNGLVQDNTMKETFGYGFLVGGGDDCCTSTIDITPTNSTTLSGNVAAGNVGFGFAIYGDGILDTTGTELSGNKASKNRESLCDAGTGTVSSDNKFGTVFDSTGVGCVLVPYFD
jgi:parallel beta-helix repeat protein